MYLSEKQIGIIAKKCTGRTAKDYILYLRHEKSKDYLKCSELSISDIAELMGFSSVDILFLILKKEKVIRDVLLRIKYKKRVFANFYCKNTLFAI